MFDLVIKNGRTLRVDSLEDASRQYQIAHDASGLGVSQWPNGTVYDSGRIVAHVSYNGRVWAQSPNEWTPDAAPIMEAATI